MNFSEFIEIVILVVVLIILIETSLLAFHKIHPVKHERRKIYVDTSALIDGRIINIAKTGFMEGSDFVILKTVLLELQLIADSKDPEKRSRARVGLNNVSELERIVEINTEVVDDSGGIKKVDEELLKVAKETGGTILSTDFNLLKVAEAEKIHILNINDLSLAVRSEFSAGDRIVLKITEKGSNPGQGIGHLMDGTMVIVENGAAKLNQEISVQITRVHENSAGRIIFARIYKPKKK